MYHSQTDNIKSAHGASWGNWHEFPRIPSLWTHTGHAKVFQHLVVTTWVKHCVSRKVIRNAIIRVSMGVWFYRHPPPGVCQNFKAPDEKQVFSVNHVFCVNIKHNRPLLQVDKWWEPFANPKSKTLDKGQPCKQAFPRAAVSGLFCMLPVIILGLGLSPSSFKPQLLQHHINPFPRVQECPTWNCTARLISSTWLLSCLFPAHNISLTPYFIMTIKVLWGPYN